MSGLTPKFVLLWTDAAIWLMAFWLLGYIMHVRRLPDLRQKWRRVFQDRGAMGSAMVLAACLLLTLLDSVHYRPVLPPAQGQSGQTPRGSPAVASTDLAAAAAAAAAAVCVCACVRVCVCVRVCACACVCV